VVERRHLKIHNNMVGFERSHWVVGQPRKEEARAIPAPAPAIAAAEPVSVPNADAVEDPKEAPAPADGSSTAIALPKAAALSTLEQDLRSVVTGNLKNNQTNGKANGHGNRAAAGH